MRIQHTHAAQSRKKIQIKRTTTTTTKKYEQKTEPNRRRRRRSAWWQHGDQSINTLRILSVSGIHYLSYNAHKFVVFLHWYSAIRGYLLWSSSVTVAKQNIQCCCCGCCWCCCFCRRRHNYCCVVYLFVTRLITFEIEQSQLKAYFIRTQNQKSNNNNNKIWEKKQ